METIKFNVEQKGKSFKVLNATNGGPWYKRYANDQFRSNFEEYKAARIPFSRNHDSNICGSIYGGPFCHDISVIFPNFDADVNDPNSYDFACTDENILATLDAGTETFFRLGQSIEHQIKKHGTIPPKDFKKWAVICEHVIRHYNEGWASGYNLNIKYWEIWNEPDLDADDSTHKRTWGGTKREFFDLYETASKHLKACFPNLMIGGPALACEEEWASDFLEEMRKRNVEIDFFSWHIYTNVPSCVYEKSVRIKELLVKNGYENAESILNEWNYIEGWCEEFKSSIKAIHSIKGAAFTMACMSDTQYNPNIDMLMYYDTRPSAFCGLFDYYTYDKLKGYYPFMWYGKFYDLAEDIESENKLENVYTLCGKYANGKILCVVTYYSAKEPESKKISLDFGKTGKYEIYLLDDTHDGEMISETDKLEFTLVKDCCILVREV